MPAASGDGCGALAAPDTDSTAAVSSHILQQKDAPVPAASGDGCGALAAPGDDDAVAVGGCQQLAVKAPAHMHHWCDVALRAEIT